MTDTQSSLVNTQFGSRAAAYVASEVHAGGEDLRRIGAMVAGRRDDLVLDLGCGGGHVSYAVAPQVGRVVAYDLSQAMLDAVAQEAASRDLANIETRHGMAEHLPFADAQFDWVISRYSAHHWHNLPAALAEVARVLKPGGRLVMADLAGPVDPKADTFLQAIELLRDPSHIRSRSVAEWRSLLADARLRVQSVDCGRLRLEYRSWVDRMNTTSLHGDAIRSLQQVATQEMRDYFEIDENGSFSVDTVFIIAG